MQLKLTEFDQALLAGDFGPAAEMAMHILVRMLPVFGADRFLDIEGAHIDSTVYQGIATMEYAEKLASLGAKVRVPSTLNVSGVDEHGWREWAVPPDYAQNAYRQMVAYQSMGCIPTWTCAPYQTEHRPKFGQQIAWGESNAISFANSVIGARTLRYPDLLDICAAITGRAPATGLHLTENRAGEVVLRLQNVPARLQENDAFYPVLGHILGKFAGERIPVIEGMAVQPNDDQMKALCAAAASSGAVAMFHMVGITPEAPTLAQALHDKKPLQTQTITMAELRIARNELSTTGSEKLDLVVLGSPHFSLAEFQKLTPLLKHRRRHAEVQFLVTTNRAVAQLAKKIGMLEILKAFGGQLTVDTCILTSPMLPEKIKVLMTNSAKFAYYAPGLLGTQVVYGSLDDCVRSAVEGRMVRDDSLWEEMRSED